MQIMNLAQADDKTKVRVKMVKSFARRPKEQEIHLRSLGLKHMHDQVELKLTRGVVGLLLKTRHMIEVTKI